MSDQPSPSGKLIVGHDGAITTITLNRPQVHNALDQEISAELNAAVKDVAGRYADKTGHKPYIFRGSSPGAAAFGHLRMAADF